MSREKGRAEAPQTDAFGAAYFEKLYGEERKQSFPDKLRDDSLEKLVTRHAPSAPYRTGGRPALLDIGCGYGYLLHRFRDRYDVYGIDISEYAAGQVAARPGVAAVACGSVEEDIGFDRLFSVILMVNVLEHLREPRRALDNVRAGLIRGGICVVHLPTVNNRFNRAVYAVTYAKDPTHVFRPSGFEVRGLFESAGFELVEESYFPHRPRALAKALKVYPPYLGVFRRR